MELKRWIVMGVVLCQALLFCSCFKEPQEIKAYKEYMSQEKIPWTDYDDMETKDTEYSFKDINNDGVQEMMLRNDRAANNWGWYRLYTYYDNEIHLLWGSDNGGSEGRFYPKKGIFVSERFHQDLYEEIYYRFDGKKLMEKYTYREIAREDEKAEEGYRMEKTYYKDGEEISYIFFQSEIETLIGKAKEKRFEFKND